MQKGMGNTLGFVAIVVGLGSMMGGMLEVSGGAQCLAHNLIRWFGVKRSSWALGLAGFLVSIPVFFDVGLVILMPVLYGMAKDTKRPLMGFAIPLMAGMVTTHAFVPPTPGPTMVAEALNADLGMVVGFGALVGLPAMICAGPLFGRYIESRVDASAAASVEERDEATELPSFASVAGMIGLPLVLMVLAAVAHGMGEGVIWQTLIILGHPFVALLITVLLCFWMFGNRRGLTGDQVQTIATKALEPAGIVILVTGAGGLLKQVMIEAHVGDAFKTVIEGSNMPIILVGFVVAAAFRVMQGSATVAMVAGAAFSAQLIDGAGVSEPTKALLVISIASGATFLSHVNDSGFWLVNRFMGLSVADTLKSWTVMTMIIGGVGLVLCLTIGAFV
jgi:Gnt-I system low-affinity gluconate transporter